MAVRSLGLCLASVVMGRKLVMLKMQRNWTSSEVRVEGVTITKTMVVQRAQGTRHNSEKPGYGQKASYHDIKHTKKGEILQLATPPSPCLT